MVNAYVHKVLFKYTFYIKPTNLPKEHHLSWVQYQAHYNRQLRIYEGILVHYLDLNLGTVSVIQR